MRTHDRAGRASLLLVAALVLTAACGGSSPAPGSGTPTAGPPATSAAATAGPDGSATPDGSTTFDHQPLWPFATAADARAWQESYRSGGHQPWHLDADATALGFTQGYLGFAGVDKVVTRTVSGDEAWVGVGFALPDGRDATAALVHLARFGDGADAPWEVVGTRDDTLALDTPRYGARVVSPVTVGGTITGVDESLRVSIRRLDRSDPIGEHCCVPAGGQHERWSAEVAFDGPGTGALTIVVSTGGHVADVERFAITGVRAG